MTAALSQERLIAELAAQRATILTRIVLALVDKHQMPKSDNSLVSMADFGAQALIIAAIHKSFPYDKIMAEESAEILRNDSSLKQRVWELVSSTRLEDNESELLLGRPESIDEMCDLIDFGRLTNSSGIGRVWIIDPVDGTKTFLAGTQYAVVISLLIDGVDQLGVTACPKLDLVSGKISESNYAKDGPGYIISAVRGKGAQIRPISSGALLSAKAIQKVSGKVDMKNLIFVDNLDVTRPRFPRRHEFATSLGAPWPPVHIYSSQVTYIALALGIVDYQVHAVHPDAPLPYIWDHAGGIAIYEECGGKVTDFNGRRLDLGQGEKLAANYGNIGAAESIHGKVLSMAREKLKEIPEYAQKLTT